MQPIVYVHADESCLGVQFTDRDSPGGAGALLETWHGGAWVRRDVWMSDPATTNNRMALSGAVQALDALRGSRRVVFVSDSQYLVRGMREWVHAWARNAWKRRAGPVENLTLWQDLVRAAHRHQIDWRWVRGHAGHPRNEYANHLATRAAKRQDATAGPVPSEFTAWLEEQREKHGRYFEYHEWQPPGEERFDAVRPPPVAGG